MNSIGSNKCVFCGSKSLYISEPDERTIKETCEWCNREIIYDRIKVGRKERRSYITAVVYALGTKEQKKVMLTAAGRRRLVLLDTLNDLNSGIEVIEWKQQETDLGGLEFRAILKES